jgi:hypothetical protein
MCAPGASWRRAFVVVGCRHDQAMRQHAPVFRPVSIVLRPCFSLFFALFFPLAFSFDISMTFPVFGAPGAL